jgi:hypothetical protein
MIINNNGTLELICDYCGKNSGYTFESKFDINIFRYDKLNGWYYNIYNININDKCPDCKDK